MPADVEPLARLMAEAENTTWNATQRLLLQRLASALERAQPAPVRLRLWESEAYVGVRGPEGRALNVAFDHPRNSLWEVEVVLDDEGDCQAWLIRGDDTHIDWRPCMEEAADFLEALLTGTLTLEVKHYDGRVAALTAHGWENSFLVPPSNVPLRTRLLKRSRVEALRWSGKPS